MTGRPQHEARSGRKRCGERAGSGIETAPRPQAAGTRSSSRSSAIVLAIGALYVWTAATSPEGRNLHLALADAFEHGQTSLRIDPPRKLLALENPYDPDQNAPYRINDASLYKDRWYLYFGPVAGRPVLPAPQGGGS